MKRYELKYTKGETGVFCMSQVEVPAVGATLVMFDDESKLMEFQDDEKQIVYSVAMRPNINIPRKNINGEPAMAFYSEETVSDLQQNFFKNSSHIGATVNHDKNVRNDVYAFESWIVQDPEKDKATLLGMSVEKGDWVLGQKVDNPEVWQKIKNKELQGFSIEAYLNPILTPNEIEMTKEEIKELVKVTMAEQTPDPAPTPPAVQEPKGEDLQKKIDELTAENNDLKAKIAEFETKETEMSAQLVEMKDELKKGIPAKGNEKPKKYEEMTNVEKAKFNQGKL